MWISSPVHSLYHSIRLRVHHVVVVFLTSRILQIALISVYFNSKARYPIFDKGIGQSNGFLVWQSIFFDPFSHATPKFSIAIPSFQLKRSSVLKISSKLYFNEKLHCVQRISMYSASIAPTFMFSRWFSIGLPKMALSSM